MEYCHKRKTAYDWNQLYNVNCNHHVIFSIPISQWWSSTDWMRHYIIFLLFVCHHLLMFICCLFFWINNFHCICIYAFHCFGIKMCLINKDLYLVEKYILYCSFYVKSLHGVNLFWKSCPRRFICMWWKWNDLMSTLSKCDTVG